MPWQLQATYAGGCTTVLPPDSSLSAGRRASNNIACHDLAVSGQHCIFHSRRSVQSDPPEVEDCSTNGTYVNDQRLSKGQRRRLAEGDVISLTNPVDEDAPEVRGVSSRIQFKVEFTKDRGAVDRIPAANSLIGVVDDVPPTAPERQGVENTYAVGATTTASAQDLLLQEQQKKGKITGELLQAQRKLDEERQAVAVTKREHKRVRALADEERTRRREAEETLERLQKELETLRVDKKQLQELQVDQQELKKKHDASDVELQERLRKCVHLESDMEEFRMEVERSVEAQRKATQQVAEYQARIRQTQERNRQLEKQVEETKERIAKAAEDKIRVQAEIASERSARKQVEEQVGRDKQSVADAEEGECERRERLDNATARRADLECQVSAAQADAEALRTAARHAEQWHANAAELAERLRQTGRQISSELRRRADLWENALLSGEMAGIEDMLNKERELPTFAQVTCRMDPDTPPRHRNDGGDSPSTAPEADREDPDSEIRPSAGSAAAVHDCQDSPDEPIPATSCDGPNRVERSPVFCEPDSPKLTSVSDQLLEAVTGDSLSHCKSAAVYSGAGAIENLSIKEREESTISKAPSPDAAGQQTIAAVADVVSEVPVDDGQAPVKAKNPNLDYVQAPDSFPAAQEAPPSELGCGELTLGVTPVSSDKATPVVGDVSRATPSPEAKREAPGGCSTAWSLEVLDLEETTPPPKRLRFG